MTSVPSTADVLVWSGMHTGQTNTLQAFPNKVESTTLCHLPAHTAQTSKSAWKSNPLCWPGFLPLLVRWTLESTCPAGPALVSCLSLHVLRPWMWPSLPPPPLRTVSPGLQIQGTDDDQQLFALQYVPLLIPEQLILTPTAACSPV
jgi:hypothetical protein